MEAPSIFTMQLLGVLRTGDLDCSSPVLCWEVLAPFREVKVQQSPRLCFPNCSQCKDVVRPEWLAEADCPDIQASPERIFRSSQRKNHLPN